MNSESFAFILVYVLCFQLICINSGSTLWKLNPEQTKVIGGSEIHSKLSLFEGSISDEEIFNIISSTVFHGETWLKQNNERTQITSIKVKDDPKHSGEKSSSKCPLGHMSPEEMATFEIKPPMKSTNMEDSLYECGKPINFTHYDNLIGVYNRFILPNVTNPQSASVFGYHMHNEVDNEETTLMVNFSDYLKFLVRCIKKEKQQNSHSAALYNFLGNYWQLKGYSLKSIECFRKGLTISPHNARILLNLARLLFSLQYLDDAIYLTKRSLEMEQIQNGVWIHHFTLGEIFKAYGLYQEAVVHLNHSLKLKPDLTVAQVILQEIRAMHLSDRIHSNTIFIIISLVLLVLGVIVLSHNLHFDMSNERHVFRVTDGARYLKSLRRNHRFRKPSA